MRAHWCFEGKEHWAAPACPLRPSEALHTFQELSRTPQKTLSRPDALLGLSRCRSTAYQCRAASSSRQSAECSGRRWCGAWAEPSVAEPVGDQSSPCCRTACLEPQTCGHQGGTALRAAGSQDGTTGTMWMDARPLLGEAWAWSWSG